MTANIQRPLTIEAIQRSVPSAFATQPASHRSERYVYIPTHKVIEGMAEAGFLPFSAKQSKATGERAETTKHIIRFRSEAMLSSTVGGDSIPEVVLVNSHDGTSSYQLMLGIFRIVCMNGLVVAESMQAAIKVRHQGNIIQEVIAGSQTVIEQAPRLMQNIDAWRRVQLNTEERVAFAESVRDFRYDEEDRKRFQLDPIRLLSARRSEDVGTDLWRTMNVVQENVMKGGIKGLSLAGVLPRRLKTRGIKSIDADLKLNKAIFAFAEKMAKIKQAN